MKVVNENSVELSETESLAMTVYESGLNRGLGIPEASIRIRKMFLCSDEFFEFLTGMPFPLPGNFVSIKEGDLNYPGDWPNSWRPEGEYIALTTYNEYGIFRAIKADDSSQPVNLYIGWVKEIVRS